MAYDPYKTLAMLQIYGKEPPMSFKIRMKKFEEMKTILDRYAQSSPVQAVCVLDELKRNWRGSRRDYIADKEARIWSQDREDVGMIMEEFLEGNALYHEKP